MEIPIGCIPLPDVYSMITTVFSVCRILRPIAYHAFSLLCWTMGHQHSWPLGAHDAKERAALLAATFPLFLAGKCSPVVATGTIYKEHQKSYITHVMLECCRRTPGSAAVDGLGSACSVATSCVGPPATSFPPLCWAPCICTPSVVILCLAFHLLANVHSLHEHTVIFIIIVISSPHTVSVRGRRTLTHLLSGCAHCHIQILPSQTQVYLCLVLQMPHPQAHRIPHDASLVLTRS